MKKGQEKEEKEERIECRRKGIEERIKKEMKKGQNKDRK